MLYFFILLLPVTFDKGAQVSFDNKMDHEPVLGNTKKESEGTLLSHSGSSHSTCLLFRKLL